MVLLSALSPIVVNVIAHGTGERRVKADNDNNEWWSRRRSTAEILYHVALSFRITVKVLRGRTRHHALAGARREAIWLLRYERLLSLNQIGRVMSGRHHTTILQYLDEVQKNEEASVRTSPTCERRKGAVDHMNTARPDDTPTPA